jgi:hypothetical protein
MVPHWLRAINAVVRGEGLARRREVSKPLVQPLRFVFKPCLPMEVAQASVAANYIKPDAPLKLAQVNLAHDAPTGRAQPRLF